MASAPQEFTKFDTSAYGSEAAGGGEGGGGGGGGGGGRGGSVVARLQHGRGKWMALLSVTVVVLSIAGLFQKPHTDAYRVVHTVGFDSRGQFSTSGLRDWLLHPIERNAFLRLPAITSQVRDIAVAPNSDSIWIVGDHGMILHSPDDGLSWVAQSLPPLASSEQLVPEMGRDIPVPEEAQVPNQRQDNAQQQQQQRPADFKPPETSSPKGDSTKEMAPPKGATKRLSKIQPFSSESGQPLLTSHASNATYVSAPPPEKNTSPQPIQEQGPVTSQSASELPPPPAAMMKMAENVFIPSSPAPLSRVSTLNGLDITNASFYDQNNGWLIAEPIGGYGDIILFYTSNAGKVWQQVGPTLTPGDLEGMMDANVGVTAYKALAGGRLVLGCSKGTIITIDVESQSLEKQVGPVSLSQSTMRSGLLHSGRWYFVDSSTTPEQLVKGQIGQPDGVRISLTNLQGERIGEIRLGEDETGLAITNLGNIIRIQADGSHQYVKLPQAVTSLQSSDRYASKLIDGNTAIIEFNGASGPEHIMTKNGGNTWDALSIQRSYSPDESLIGRVTQSGTVYGIEVMGEPSYIAQDNVRRKLSRESRFVMTPPAIPGSLVAVSDEVIMSSKNQGQDWSVISRRNQSIKVPPQWQTMASKSGGPLFNMNPMHFQWDPPLSNATLPFLNADALPPLPQGARLGSFLAALGERVYFISGDDVRMPVSIFTCKPGDSQWTLVESDLQFKESPLVAMGVSHVSSPPSLRVLFANLIQYDVQDSRATRVHSPGEYKSQTQLLGQTISDIENQEEIPAYLSHLAFVSPSKIVFTYHGNVHLESLDNGLNWIQAYEPYDIIQLDRAACLAPTFAVAPVWDGTFRYSTDGATTWSKADTRILPYRKLPAPWYWLAMSAACLVLVPRVVRRPVPIAAGRPTIETVAISDAPLQPGQPDHLGLLKLSRGISLFLRNSNTKTPLTVAIEAPWGAGKSSLMNLLAKELRDNGCRTAWFNAWHHQGEESLLAALLETIRTGVNPPVWTMQGLVFRYRLWWRRFQHAMKVRPLPILGLLAVFCASAGVMWWSMQNPALPKPTTPVVANATTQGTDAAKTSDDPKAVTEKGFNEEAIMRTAASGVANFFNQMGLIGVASKVSLVISFIFLALPTLRAMTAIGISPSKLLATAAGSMKPADLEAQTSFRVRFARQFQEVTQALEPESKLIIFIDDIDRCSEEVVAQTLQACNYLVTSGRCIIVLGMDAAYVRACVNRTYGDLLKDVAEEKKRDGVVQTTDFASNYLEKLVNIRITLPRVTTDTVKGLTTGKVEKTPQHIQLLRRIPVLAGIAMVLFFVGLTAIGMGYGGWLFAPTLFGRTASTPVPLVIQPPSASTQTGVSAQSVTPRRVPTVSQQVFIGRKTPPMVAPGEEAPRVVWIPLAIIGGLSTCLVLILTRRRVVLPVDSAAWTEAINAMSTALVHNRHSTPREIKRIMNRLRFDAMRLRAEAPQSEWWTPFLALFRKFKAWRAPAAQISLNASESSLDKDNLNDQAIAVYGMLRDAYPQWLSSREFWAEPATFALQRSSEGTLTPEAAAYLSQHRETLDVAIKSLRPKFEEISQVGASNSLDATPEPKVSSKAPGETQTELRLSTEHSA